MTRKKEYIEADVIEKALELFWPNGYNNTSMQQLEKKMGINKFSIYSSFGSKHGVYSECLKLYKTKTKNVFDDLLNSENGVDAIKKYFYGSLDIWYLNGKPNGCMIAKTYNEFGQSNDEKEILLIQLIQDRLDIKNLLIKKLKADTTKSEETILRQANFLMVALHALGTAPGLTSEDRIKDFIEVTFETM